MNVRIEPRKPTDRGGYIMMPLYKNVPAPPNSSWKLIACQECGNLCWEKPLPDGFTMDMFSGAFCTECAIKKGAAVQCRL